MTIILTKKDLRNKDIDIKDIDVYSFKNNIKKCDIESASIIIYSDPPNKCFKIIKNRWGADGIINYGECMMYDKFI